jgi:Tol biopolymer transport system component
VVVLLTLVPEKPAEAAFPGKNGKIAFNSYEGGIWTINPDGSNRTQLPVAGPTYLGAWSPDGTRIAFTRDQSEGLMDIWTMNADGTNQTNITNTINRHEGGPVWSPDGTKIAFSSCCLGHDFFEIYIMNADGSNPTRLTYDTGEEDARGNLWIANSAYDWSPDGTKIVYVRTIQTLHTDFYPQIYTMNADGSNPTNLSERHSGEPPFSGDYQDEESNPVWSPDGTQIAFNSKNTGNREIYVMDPDGSNVTQLTHEASYEWTQAHGCDPAGWYYNADPAWSPDGTKIAFESNRCVGDQGLYTMNADGSNQTFLTAGHSPAWQPLAGGATLPTSKAQCKHGGYKDFGFKNQGRCVAYVQKAKGGQ